ncbi:MAG TPA: hypothetical protein VMG12_10750 [Polyangiaceae bacterium]|nr:hypothetical protein [Polyangiaceae bacterium]
MSVRRASAVLARDAAARAATSVLLSAAVVTSAATARAQPTPEGEPPPLAPTEPAAVPPPTAAPPTAAPPTAAPLAPPTPAPATPAPASPATAPAPAPAAAAPAATPEETEALMAELDAELQQTGFGTESGTPSLSLYGFADAGFHKHFIEDGNTLNTILYPKGAFAVGNLNLYLASDLGNSWRSLVEVRFTYLPNGNRSATEDGIVRTNTETIDYVNFSRPRQTGSIFIERAWVEYAVDQLLVLRLGNWLTPYGIWNEDHGSPTIIPVARPYVIGLELLPERQTGLLALGTTYASESLTLGYALGLSNGRGPVQDYADLDENKAVTLRLHGTHRSAGVLSFGASAYYGRFTDITQGIAIQDSHPRIVDRIAQQFDELSLGLDARYVLGGFHAQVELILNQQAFTEGGRPLRSANTYQPDNQRYGGYTVIGYRFPWLGLMPYATAEYFSLINTFESTRPATNDVITDYGIGLNIRPTTNVTLKLEANIGVFYVDDPEGSAFDDPLASLQGQVAWAF